MLFLVAYMTLWAWCMADSAAAATGSQSLGSIGYGDIVGGWRSHMGSEGGQLPQIMTC